MASFLLEIGVEEIPDWMIVPALAELSTRFEAAFNVFGGSALITKATPRRLVLLVKDIAGQAPDVESVIQGPYLSAGAKAAEGFARKQGTTVEKLAKAQDAKGERYVFAQLVKGQSALATLSEKLPEVISGLHFPKAMYWTGKGGVRFIRPIRWIVALLDDQVAPFELAGVRAGNTTRGHRILGASSPLPVTIAGYFDTLRANYVIVDAEERRTRIEAVLAEGVEKDEDLLTTLVYLTEYPTPIRGSFDASYLELPKEILSTVMRHHQRYFSVLKADGSLAPEFVAVTNTDGDPDGLIRQGNERVLRARFNDARFFWEVDQHKKLADRMPDLEKVTFQAKLGSYKDKAQRMVELAAELAAQTAADEGTAKQAALLCKCDLTTDMVKEFTELQGAVGGLYAKAQGESEAVSIAIYDHYKPVSMEDSIPRTLEGQVVALADKLDTLRECFKVGMIPTGSKDPFALRRAAQGVVKILFEAKLPLEPAKLAAGIPELVAFLNERIQFYLRDVLGYPYDEVNAVMAPGVTSLSDLNDRAEALHEVRATADFESVAAGFKRIKNILTNAQFNAITSPSEELMQAGPEADLYRSFLTVKEQAARSKYAEKLRLVASLRPYVDLFFDKILVNDPDPVVRQNRLALLNSLLTEFSHIADFSEIVTQGVSA
ncbi:MAG TPA: glycine--tRNA ligase subunit beta [Bryobacteraceae bacterium]|nr:glycine--tRNA ligase subunit beta [Bryobacteraceae bacterium]